VAVPGSVPFAKTAIRPFGRAKFAGGRTAANAMEVEPLPPALLGSLEFPLLGRIAAGQPVEAIPHPETFSLGDFTRGKSNIYVLRVKGDSMIDDHICNGDYILVEGTDTAENGEIVVALTAGTDATLKRLFREPKGRVRLQPANTQMDPIILPARDVKIQGRVIGVLRKY
jgi:repressor LexA